MLSLTIEQVVSFNQLHSDICRHCIFLASVSIFRKVVAQLYFVAMFQLKAQGTPELEVGAERVRKFEAD